MGVTLAKLWNIFAENKHMRLIMVGLDNSGKTTALFKLKLGEVLVHAAPTVGFNVEQVEYCGTTFTVWDMGGQDKIRALWRYYYEGVQAIIFVIDSADRARLKEAAEELHHMLNDALLANAYLCVFANKQDLPGALSIKEVSDGLRLSSIQNRRWHIQATCAFTGEGLLEAFSWLAERCRENEKLGLASVLYEGWS